MGIRTFFENKYSQDLEIGNYTSGSGQIQESQISSKYISNVNNILESKRMSTSDYMVAFSGLTESYCVGLVDMCNSTKIAANLNGKDCSLYYSIFLNSMAKILTNFHGKVIKNGGDSLLYYFPESNKTRYGIISCIECSLAMSDAKIFIAKRMQEEKLPPLNYRVSADYGKVILMNANNSTEVDIIGPAVNMCSKINHSASRNGAVIGEDLYRMMKDLKEYHCKPVEGFSIGLKYKYPVYSIVRKY